MRAHHFYIAFLSLPLVWSCTRPHTLAEEDLLRVWLAPDVPVKDRADAINICFTNGTPIPNIVALLGTHYSIFTPFSSVWAGPGPEPRRTSGLIYTFGAEWVIIGTAADIRANPLTGTFTGAGYSLPITSSTNQIDNGQPGGSANRSQPVRPETNRTSERAGSGR